MSVFGFKYNQVAPSDGASKSSAAGFASKCEIAGKTASANLNSLIDSHNSSSDTASLSHSSSSSSLTSVGSNESDQVLDMGGISQTSAEKQVQVGQEEQSLKNFTTLMDTKECGVVSKTNTAYKEICKDLGLEATELNAGSQKLETGDDHSINKSSERLKFAGKAFGAITIGPIAAAIGASVAAVGATVGEIGYLGASVINSLAKAAGKDAPLNKKEEKLESVHKGVKKAGKFIGGSIAAPIATAGLVVAELGYGLTKGITMLTGSNTAEKVMYKNVHKHVEKAANKINWTNLSKALSNIRGNINAASNTGQFGKIGYGIFRSEAEKALDNDIKSKYGKKGDPLQITSTLTKQLKENDVAKKTFLQKVGVEGQVNDKKLAKLVKQYVNQKLNEQHEKSFTDKAENYDNDASGSINPFMDKDWSLQSSTNQTITCEAFNRDKMPSAGTHQKKGDGRCGNLQRTAYTASSPGSTETSAVRHGVTGSKVDASKVSLKIGEYNIKVSEMSLKDLDSVIQDEFAKGSTIFKELKTEYDAISGLQDFEQGNKLKGLQKKVAQAYESKQKTIDLVKAGICDHISKHGYDPDKGLDFVFSDTSLLTPDDARSITGDSEKKLVADQQKSLELLSHIEVGDLEGLFSDIKVDGNPIKLNSLATLSFNFGVNEGASLGRENEKENNLANLNKLDGIIDKSEVTSEKKAAAKTCLAQVRDIINDPSLNVSPFLAPTLIMLACDEVGIENGFCCMSGKDRTGREDVNFKFAKELLAQYTNDRISPEEAMNKIIKDFNDLEADFQTEYTTGKQRSDHAERNELRTKYDDIFTHSANAEVQTENTGFPGDKQAGVISEARAKSYSGRQNTFSIMGASLLTNA